jgi:hypothetical protein
MNMKKNLLLLILIASLTSGCKQLVLWKYGIHSPKPETPESILTFAEKNKQPSDNIYLFRDSLAYARFMKDSLLKTAYFSAIVFNRKGEFIEYKNPASCQWSAAEYVEKLKRDTTYQALDAPKLWTVIPGLIGLNGTSFPVPDSGKVDYTIIFTWAKYIGKLNERLFCINDAARNNRQAEIRVISLNVDVQKSWNMKNNQKIRMN